MSTYFPTERVSSFRVVSENPAITFLYFVVAYVVLFVLAALPGLGFVRVFSHLLAVIGFLFFFVRLLFIGAFREDFLGFGVVFLVYFYGMIGVALFGGVTLASIGDYLKFLMAPFFLLVGVSFERKGFTKKVSNERYQFFLAALVVAPAVLAAYQYVSYGFDFPAKQPLSVFANRNNAGLYLVSLVALWNVFRQNPMRSVALYLAVGVACGTLGVLFAVIAAMVLSVAGVKLRAGFLFAGVVVLFLAIQFPDAPLLSRIWVVLNTIHHLYLGNINLATATYAELVSLLNTTDLSFVFRLKHWNELWEAYISSGWVKILFGSGVNHSVFVTSTGLIPHNDYLRYMFECGLFVFTSFILIVSLIFYRACRGWIGVPLLSIILYFFSENLVNNYVAMVLFYFSAGSLAWRAHVQGREQRCVR